MHGVRKQPTTNEQQAQRAKDGERKKLVYEAARNRLFAKQESGKRAVYVTLNLCCR
jgi:hypothetical protein